jgi:glycosyltransferase 2 family protein
MLDEDESSEDVRAFSASWLRRHALALVASIAVAGGFVWLLKAGALPVVPPRSAFADVRWSVALGYAAIFIGVHVARCSRWGLLIAPAQRPKLGLTIALGMIGYGALVLLPFRLGEAARPALLHGKAKVPLGTSAGIVAAERIVDGLVLSSVLFASLLGAKLVSPLPERIGNLPIPASIIPTVAWGGVIVFGSLSLGMVVFYLCQDPLRRLVDRTLGKFAPKLALKLSQVMASVADGFRFLRDLSTLPAFALLTALYWGLSIVGIWLLAWASGVPSPTLAQASIILGVIGLGLVVPNAPGFFGTFQISAYSAMVLFYPLEVVTAAGAVVVFLLDVIQMTATLGSAAAALVWLLSESSWPRGLGRHRSSEQAGARPIENGMK